MMRRTVTLRTTLLIAAPLLLTALLPARAEEAPFVSIVTDLAPGDLLNVRATASAMGKIKARLPNGTSVNNLGCNDVNGHRWCKVAEIDNPQLAGWAPARYLNPENPAAVSDIETSGENMTAAAGDSNPATADQPPPDLTARLDATGREPTMTAVEAIGRVAIEDAYRLALFASENPSAGETQAPAAAAADKPIRNRAANAAPPANAQTVARLQPPGRPAPALGARNEIPCARHVGQPMTSCKAGVVHTGDKAEVTVTWPDGGTRVISFQAGRPAGSNASGEFRYTREGSLNIIRVGVAERFEITDALALGDEWLRGIRQ